MPLHWNKPIVVTGSPRSGSTWVGEMIASHPWVRFFSEPFNPEQPGCPVGHHFHYMTAATEPSFLAYLRRWFRLKYPWRTKLKARRGTSSLVSDSMRAVRYFLDRCLGIRPLIKDPMALLSAEWIARNYDADMILLIRHPAAFASSLKRLDWRFPFGDLLHQKQLMEDHLEPFHDAIERFTQAPPDLISQAILLWRVLHFMILRYQVKHPDWIFVRHEDLSVRPQEEFANLFQRIGLRFSAKVRRTLRDYTQRDNPVEAEHKVVHQLKRNSAGNIWNWRHRLQPDEIRRIRKGTADIAHHFYSEADWNPTGTSITDAGQLPATRAA